MEQQQTPSWRSRKVGKFAAGQDAGLSSRTKGARGKKSVEKSADVEQPDESRSIQGVGFMVLDIVEEATGTFHVWGTACGGRSVLVRVEDFQPYFFVAAPLKQESLEPATSESDLLELKTIWNRALPNTSRIREIVPAQKRPIMFYRPSQPQGSTYLKITFPAGASMKRAGKAVHECKAKVQAAGYSWERADMHEHEVHLLQRFLVDTGLSAGCWTYMPPATEGSVGWQAVDAKSRVSDCALELIAPWASLQALTPDATQITDWAPQPVESALWREVRGHAVEGVIAPLRLVMLDVQMAPKDGKKRVPVPASDPIVAITSILNSSNSIFSSSKAADDSAATVGGGGDNLEGDEEADPVDGFPDPNAAAASELPSHGGKKVVMSWQKGGGGEEFMDPSSGAKVRLFETEQEMLTAWVALVKEYDPDALIVFQVSDTLGALAERLKALRVEGGGLHLSRAAAGSSKPLALKRVVQYNPNWVKNQQRMASTSNQETFRADIDGRLVFDLLRHVLTACNLASFSLVDCVFSLLGRTLEILPPDALATLASLKPGFPQLTETGQDDSRSRMLRLIRYTCSRAVAVQGLLARLSTIAETLELARATGLTAGQSLYNAQMIRTHSLLLRTAQRTNFIIGGRQDVVQLQESPYLMHPVEEHTVGLYKEPVAILDFASLYPSVFRAYNMSYDTLLHKEDASALTDENVFTTPTGDAFVKPEIRRGVLPTILAALIEARTATRAALANAEDPAQRAVLDSRQKALKITANALYGFTGAQASPLQCVQLADSCLALGAMSCKQAKALLDDFCSDGQLGPKAKGGRVIYGQTDSLFCHLPGASAAEAVAVAKEAARRVSASFPAPMELKYERVCQPFMLLHVNRYAGRAFETAEAAEEGKGVLMVKGLKSMWRQAAPILRTTLQGSLQRIIMREDVGAAVRFVEAEVRRLLEGRAELSEMVMTGGLWRVTGQQLAEAAHGTNAGEGMEVRGPHATLAVKLQQRDKGRSFVLGERLQYVLLPGERLQDEAAEDPLTAAIDNRPADWELYWRAKLQRPLQELFATCLSDAALQRLMNGPHTKVRVEQATVTPQKSAAAQKGAQQTGLAKFYKATVRCLACKRPISKAELEGKDGHEPGLCRSCREEKGTLARVHLDVLNEANAAESRFHLANASCMRCHSGGQLGAILCENGECAVLYSRLNAGKRLTAAVHSLERLDW